MSRQLAGDGDQSAGGVVVGGPVDAAEDVRVAKLASVEERLEVHGAEYALSELKGGSNAVGNAGPGAFNTLPDVHHLSLGDEDGAVGAAVDGQRLNNLESASLGQSTTRPPGHPFYRDSR